ncbi:hypothetical protein AALO_G00257090 [Alosa alosa]|uniref:Uncharacterized protein n=1 Tax=Alosa alosa TaxID=278164 RepID=A0AAV6FPA2_9TELE|nr:hypothetical protein AALO_G00257090 [Alosa alosa]
MKGWALLNCHKMIGSKRHPMMKGCALLNCPIYPEQTFHTGSLKLCPLYRVQTFHTGSLKLISQISSCWMHSC